MGAKIPAANNENLPNNQKAVVQNTSVANSSIMQMINYAQDNGGVGHETEIQQAKLEIETSSKPPKGNRKEAHRINDLGLALLKKQDFDGAVAKFVEASQIDSSDVEIVNNLGYAYLKQKSLDSAEKTLISALTIAPDRAMAWANLGDVLALKNDESKAVACYANTYRFSKNIFKTHQFMKNTNSDENIPTINQARNIVINWAQKNYPDLY